MINVFSNLTNLIVLLAIGCLSAQAQQCSPDALAAKYWQYRQNLNEHFIVIDSKSPGE